MIEGFRLALFLPSLAGGGAERMMVHLARGLRERGVAVDLVLAHAVGPYLAQVPADVRVIDLAAPRVLAALPALAQYIRRRRPDALLSALDHANLLALAAGRLADADLPVYVSVRNTLSISSRMGALWVDRLIPPLARRLYPWARGVIAVSAGVAADAISGLQLAPERVHVIYNPVVTPELAQHAAEPLDHPWLAGQGMPVVLGAGRLEPQKDFGTLIAAFARLRARTPARLLLLGEGSEYARLQAQARRLGVGESVRFEGFVPNPFQYMRRAQLFVLSSRWEGLPGVLIQAMACGTPVVSTDCPSGPREILDNGRLGPLVPTAAPAELAAAMGAALAAPVSADLLRARAAAFSLDTVADQYLQLLVGERQALL